MKSDKPSFDWSVIDPLPSTRWTERFLEICFEHYEKVTIFISGQHVFGSSPSSTSKTDWRPAIWNAVEQVSREINKAGGSKGYPQDVSLMGCGNGSTKLGDQAQVHLYDPRKGSRGDWATLFHPGVYIRGLPQYVPTEEDVLAAKVEWRLGAGNVFEEGFLLVCPHGTKVSCEEGCFDKFGEW